MVVSRRSFSVRLLTGYTSNPTLLVSVWLPRKRVSDIPVIFLPGAGGGADDVYGLREWEGVISAGFVGGCANLSALGQGWGNPTERAAALNLISWLGSTFGTRTDQVGLMAGSMGGLTAGNLIQAGANGGLPASKIAANVMIIPALDLLDVRQRDIDTLHLGLDASIEAAWGGLAGLRAALPGASPGNNPAAARDAADVTRIWAAPNDNVCSWDVIQRYATGAGITVVNVGNIGHVSGTGGGYWPEIVEWMEATLLGPQSPPGQVGGSLVVEGAVRSL